MKLPLSPKYLLLIIFFIVVLGYAAYQLSGIIRRPNFSIDYPPDGTTIKDELLTIRGRATDLTKLLLDDGKLITRENGQFEVKLLLAKGYNIIRLAGADRFGRTVEKKLQLLYVPRD